jgi:RNA polymerase sigma-70 factor (ECF subfamily)
MESSIEDYEAIRRLKKGELDGLQLLIARHQAKALRTAFLVTQDEMLAEDIVSASFIRFYERISQFDDSRAFEPYFLRSVVNAGLNAVRRESRQIPLPAGSPSDDLEGLFTRASAVEDEVERLHLRRRIQAALVQLPVRQRAAVVLRYYLDLSEREIAAELDAPRGTVKWLLNAARVRLRGLLAPERGMK